MNLDNAKSIKHIVFTTSSKNRFDYEYDIDLLQNSYPTIETHFNQEIKTHIMILVSKLASIYNIVCEIASLKGRVMSPQIYTELSSTILDKKNREMHDFMVGSNLLRDVYSSINPDLTSDSLRSKLLLAIERY